MRKTRIVAALAALATAAVAAPAASAACTPKNNLEAIIDDSGSMSWNDPTHLRIRATELLIDTQGNEKRTLGAVEFGATANPLFGPGPIGPNAAAFKAAANAALTDDGGGTDYDKAFAAAASHNPAATARIFLTDGEHNGSDAYANGHAGGPPVYVIGLGTGGAGSPFDTLLGRIATESGGLYRRADDASAMQAAMFDVNSAIACQTPPKRFSDDFTKVGQAEAHTVTVPSRIATAQFALSWTSSADAFTIGSFRVVRRGKTVARAAKVRKLRVSRRRGSTFTTVRVSGLVAGKLRFSVRATRLASPGTDVSLTTQVTRRAR
ncbi:MAG: von Willebrand factor type domain [Thermoleophilaceae bacterium]|nr:von Willebrand factor type domain [Thermoleophilaceae bacterium]